MAYSSKKLVFGLGVKAMQHHIFNDEPLPRHLRTELCWVRAEMYKKYKEWKKNIKSN